MRMPPADSDLFDRVAAILEEVRANVVRAINSQMVLAYWHIGREIVEHIQQGEERADYGEQLMKALSERLNQRNGKGFSITNLRYFRLFYQTYIDLFPRFATWHVANWDWPLNSQRNITSLAMFRLT